jgi:membrane associated rhomboid family serine protease
MVTYPTGVDGSGSAAVPAAELPAPAGARLVLVVDALVVDALVVEVVVEGSVASPWARTTAAGAEPDGGSPLTAANVNTAAIRARRRARGPRSARTRQRRCVGCVDMATIVPGGQDDGMPPVSSTRRATRPGRRANPASGPVAVGMAAGSMWVVEAVDTVMSHRLDRFGIRPHTLLGLRGIPLAPFLHLGFGHLAANTVPFVVLGTLVALSGLRRVITVAAAAAVSSGALAWLLGSSNEVHIGASGVIFGFLGYIGARAVFDRRIRSILVAMVAGVLFGGILWGVLPDSSGTISWQGHLGGLLGGIAIARVLHPRRGT